MTKPSIDRVAMKGVVTIHLQDGTVIPAPRFLGLQLGVNGAGTAQAVCGLHVTGEYGDPYGMIDSDHPIVYEFMQRLIDIIAAPGEPEATCYEVPAKREEAAAE